MSCVFFEYAASLASILGQTDHHFPEHHCPDHRCPDIAIDFFLKDSIFYIYINWFFNTPISGSIHRSMFRNIFLELNEIFLELDDIFREFRVNERQSGIKCTEVWLFRKYGRNQQFYKGRNHEYYKRTESIVIDTKSEWAVRNHRYIFLIGLLNHSNTSAT